LSVAEVFAYLERTGNSMENYFVNKNALLVEVGETIEAGAVDSLGGVIGIGIVLASGNEQEIENKLDKQEVYLGESNKLNYVIWDFSEEGIEEITLYLKKRFKNEKLKATEKKLRPEMEMQNGGKSGIVSSSNVNEQYFIFEDNLNRNYFGKIVQKCDYKTLEKRDMEKPVRRESLAISPRLAKIMINLSGVKEGGRLLDAFCGIGVILDEALLQELKIVGVDNDKKAIAGARENLKWFKFSKDDYDLINNDSSKVAISDVDVMVSEPDLGEVYRKIPTVKKAKEQLREFEDLMVDVLNNLSGKISGKIVFTSPLIRTIKDRKGCNIDFILERTGLKLVKGFPIDEFRGKQIVGRRIFVLEK